MNGSSCSCFRPHHRALTPATTLASTWVFFPKRQKSAFLRPGHAKGRNHGDGDGDEEGSDGGDDGGGRVTAAVRTAPMMMV